MGNCCSGGQHDTRDLTLATQQPLPEVPKRDVEEYKEEDKELVSNVTKIQAQWRGHKARKEVQDKRNVVNVESESNRNLLPAEPVTNIQESRSIHAPPSTVAKPIETVPSLHNAHTKLTHERCGPFNYGAHQTEDADLPVLGKYKARRLTQTKPKLLLFITNIHPHSKSLS
jgi:hypothetical protein